jgi:hypothetical protein
MSGLTFEELNLISEGVKDLLDNPSSKFLKENTIITSLHRSYNYVNSQLEITVDNTDLVKDLIYSYSAWQCFGAYPVTVSESLTLEDISSYQTKLKYYERLADQSASLLNVDLHKKQSSVDSNSVIIGDYGRSMLDC